MLSFIEEVNPDVCLKLAKLSYKQFLQFYDTPEMDKNGDNDKLTSQYKMLIEYCNLQIKNKYQLNIDYKFANNKSSGRIFVKQTLGLQRIWNKFRGILCDGLNIDLDMNNAHPTILLYLCKLHKIECENLQDYVSSRKIILESIMKTDRITKEQAKILFISSMNKEEPLLSYFLKKREVLYKNEFYIKFDGEMKRIQNKLVEFYPAEFKEVEKKSKTNVKGKLLNTIMCKYENNILQMAITRLNDMNCIVKVPMFDGCMTDIRNVNFPIETIINTLDETTKEYNIKWSNKSHNIEIIDKLNLMTFDSNLHSFIGNDELSVANYVLETILKNKIYNCNGEIFIYNKPLWTNKDLTAILVKILSPHELMIEGSFGPNNINKDTRHLNSLISLIQNLAPVKSDFFEIMHKDTQQRLFYKNGYYDFKLSKFIEYDDNNMPFTTFTIQRDYIVNESTVDEIYNRIWYPIFNIDLDDNNIPIDNDVNNEKLSMMKFCIYQFARKLAGHIEDKTWMFFLGERNSGKGVIQSSLSNTFGNYVSTVNSANFISKKMLGEISKELAWMVDFEFSRLLFSSEINQELDIKTGHNKIKFNGTIIKSIMSGGSDEIECRTNNKDARKFIPQCSLIMCANDIPKCEPTNTMDFMQRIDMPCRFISDDIFNQIPVSLQSTFIRKMPDGDLKNWIKLDEVKQGIEYILFEAYKTVIPMPLPMVNDELRDTVEDDSSKLLQIFDVNVDTVSSRRIDNKKIVEYLAINHIAMSLIKATKILKQKGAVPFRNSTSRGLSGIKYTGNNEIVEED